MILLPGQKTAIKAYLQEKGTWSEAYNYRDGLKAQGLKPSAAWVQMAQKYAPEMVGAIQEGVKAPSDAVTPEAEKAANPPKKRNASKPKPPVQLVPPPVVAKPTGPRRDWSDFDLKKFKVVDDVRWIYNALGKGDVTEDEAPTPGAWGMYCWAHISDYNRTEFYKTFGKLLPSGKSLELDEAFRDDDRGLDRLLTALRKAADAGGVLPVRAEDVQGERAIPSNDAGGGTQ